MDTTLKFIGAAIVAALLAVAVLGSLWFFTVRGRDVEATAVTVRVPEFSWSASPSETFAMDSSSIRTWNFSRGGKIKLTITSDSPVSFMVGDPETIKAAIVPSNGFNAPRLQPSGDCSGIDMLQSETSCDAKAGDVLIVQDSRGLSEQATGIAGIVFGRNSAAMNAANMKTRVTLNMATWRCVRNC